MYEKCYINKVALPGNKLPIFCIMAKFGVTVKKGRRSKAFGHCSIMSSTWVSEFVCLHLVPERKHTDVTLCDTQM